MNLSSTAGEYHENDSCAGESIGPFVVKGASDKQSSISSYQLGLCMRAAGTVNNQSDLTGDEISALNECHKSGLVPESMKEKVRKFLGRVKRKAPSQ